MAKLPWSYFVLAYLPKILVLGSVEVIVNDNVCDMPHTNGK